MAQTIIKTCSKHGDTVYVLRRNGKYYCRKCNVEAVKRRRAKVKELLIEYKGGKCELCGYDRCWRALEFHHLDPNNKNFSISADGHTRSLLENITEVDKCILVCSNCHREIHDNFVDISSYVPRVYDINEIIEVKKKEHKCDVCGCKIDRHAKKCSKCSRIASRRTERPSSEELLNLIKTKSFLEIGRMYEVSDNAVRKWCKFYGLPYRKKDIKNNVSPYNSVD